MNSLLVAVDGGGSGTRLWVLDEAGRKLAEGHGGPSSVMAVGVERAVQAVADAARGAGLAVAGDSGAAGARGVTDACLEACTEAGTEVGAGVERRDPGETLPTAGGRVAVAAVTMAGVDREPEKSEVQAGVQRLFPGARIVIEHDAVGALLAGTLGEPGVLLLAGTGSIAMSRGPKGETVRVGGWGYLLDDAGSGYAIGREALRRALRAKDGRGRPTVLTETLKRATGVGTILDLVGPVHLGEYDRPAIARWASLVLRAADGGDEVARAVVDEAAGELALLAGTVVHRAPWFKEDVVPVVAAGGLFAMGTTWRKRVRLALARIAPQARLTVWVKAPIVGAAYVALQHHYESKAGASGAQPIPADVMQTLKQLQEQSVEPF